MKELTKRNYVSPIVTMTSIQLEEGICGNTDEITRPGGSGAGIEAGGQNIQGPDEGDEYIWGQQN